MAMQHYTLEFDLPLEQPLTQAQQVDAKNAAIVCWYKMGALSMRDAAKLIGCTRRQFEGLLPRHGYTMMDEEDFDLELDYVKSA